MSESVDTGSLLEAVESYFELMYDYDDVRFGEVFADSAQLHGWYDGTLKRMSANEFKSALASNPSPRSKGAPRHQ